MPSIDSEYILTPKETPIGPQGIRASGQAARVSQAELAMKRRHDEDRLAEDIIEECRVQLMLKFRFLDRALWRMELVSVRSGLAYPLATDGKKIYYDPERIIARFRESFDECVRDYIHMTLHCIFRHLYDTDHKVNEAWSLTCDMVVESVALDLCGARFPSAEDAHRKSAIDEIALHAGNFLPRGIYDFLREMVQTPSGQQFQGLGRSKLNEWHMLFERDDHATWPANATDDGSGESEGDPSDGMTEDDDNPDFQNDGLQTETLGSDESGEEESRSTQDDASSPSDDDGESETPDDDAEEGSEQHFDLDDLERSHDADEEKRDWDEIAKEIEMNLETFSKEWGEEAGNLVANLALSNRRTYNYTDFLRKFMAVTEQIRLNPEEFDYTYYMFGMQTYGNMPFIEPLEYKEAQTVRDFVIAIDTSESVSGPLVRKFIEHTFSILKESEDFSTDVNIHVIQADSKVQSDLKIKSLRDVDVLMEGGNFVIRGFGGTDFRPTFDYVDMLRTRGELTDMKGMIYFTDGMGTFPEKTPDYDVAFVFIDDGSCELPPVPPWAIRLTIDERDVERLRS